MWPALSPDGQHIVFCAEEVTGAYMRQTSSGLWTVDVGGGAPRKIDDGDAVQPAWSPSGKRIAFWQSISGRRDIVTMPAAGGAPMLVTKDAATDWAPVWSPDGRFLYFASDRGGSMGIWRIGIDEASGRTTGAPEVVAAGVDVSMDLPHVSADGSFLVFRSMSESVNPAAIAFDPVTERAGDVRLLQHRTGMLMPTDVSPDAKWIALDNMSERQQDIFIMRPDGSGLSRLTDDLARDWWPRFTPDGTALTFKSNKSGDYDGWSIRLDGSNRTRLTDMPNADSPVFASDGRRLMVNSLSTSTTTFIGTAPWPLSPNTATRLEKLSVGNGVLVPANWSRDGRWLSGEVLLPSPDGRTLYYGAHQIEANIWKVEQPKTVKK
ncbi:MAG: PD40 domain-containing protein [Acidobacteria bacterium]|nr:PD40 domain-containing protein [Acidobacteriota bacterium]